MGRTRKNINSTAVAVFRVSETNYCITTEIEEAVKKAREEAIRDINQDAKVKADLFEKELQASKQSYELKIQSLEQAIAKRAEQIESLSSQLQIALKQAQDLARKAFGNSAQSRSN